MSKLSKSKRLASLWRFFASDRCTGLLVLSVATVVLCGLVIPQGQDAMALAVDDSASHLHLAARWGLIDVFRSAWLRALGVLLVGNVVAIMTVHSFRSKQRVQDERVPPSNAQFRFNLTPRFPEQTASRLKEILGTFFGEPSVETMQGEKTIMIFDSGRSAQWAPILTHLGLVTLLLCIGLHNLSFEQRSTSAQAVLRVTDTKSGSSGVFNLRAGEQRNFFTFPDSYFVRLYKRTKNGLGPAILLERRRKNAKRGESFWIYQNAPPGFDQRHRKGQVIIEALELGMVPLPGRGLNNSPLVLLLLLGVALCFVGLSASRKAGGRIWIAFERRHLEIIGNPGRKGDPLFTHEIEQCIEQIRAAIHSN